MKAVLKCEPVHAATYFPRAFKIAVDASDVGAGGVLLQDERGVDHPVCYCSKKLC